MSTIQVMLSADFMLAIVVYGVAILVTIPMFDRIHTALDQVVLYWPWEHIGKPLLQASLMVLFIMVAYPILFGLKEAPPIFLLLSADDMRVNTLINVLFILTLLFPLLPVFGNWRELILPLQGIAASMMVFSWLAAAQGLEEITYWPGMDTVIYIILIAMFTHWLAVTVSHHIGHKFDESFNVADSGELFARCIILSFQSPAILLISPTFATGGMSQT